jgi:Tfp pilus assembly protein PilF
VTKWFAWIAPVIASATILTAAHAQADPAAKPKPDPATSSYNLGVDASKAGKYDEAILYYTKSIEIEPDLLSAYFNRGSAYNALRDHDRALADYTRVIQLNPRFIKAYINRGNIYHDRDDQPRAIADYTKAIQLDPTYTDAWFNRGNAYKAMADYDHAIADYTKATQLNPGYVGGYYNRGIAYHNKGDEIHAIADYTKALQLNPNYSAIYLHRATSYRKIGKIALADADTNMNRKLTGQPSELSSSPVPAPSSLAQSVGGYRSNWIGQKMVVTGVVSRFLLRQVNGEPYVFLYFKERPDSAVVACARDAPWLLNVLGVDDFQSVVGKTLEFNGDVVNGTCTPQGAGLWIWNRTNARIVSTQIH